MLKRVKPQQQQPQSSCHLRYHTDTHTHTHIHTQMSCRCDAICAIFEILFGLRRVVGIVGIVDVLSRRRVEDVIFVNFVQSTK